MNENAMRITNTVKAYELSKSRWLDKSHWLLTFGTVGYVDNTTTYLDDVLSPKELREFFAAKASAYHTAKHPDTPMYVPAENVRLYRMEPASAHCDQGWVEIDDQYNPIAYDQSGFI